MIELPKNWRLHAMDQKNVEYEVLEENYIFTLVQILCLMKGIIYETFSSQHLIETINP